MNNLIQDLKKNFIVEVFKFFIDEDGYKGVDFIVKVIFIFLENEQDIFK